MISYSTHAADIVGYTFQADNHCPDCILKFFTDNTNPDKGTETWLDYYAGVFGIDRHDESSFDSGDFPKVIFASMVETTDERCGSCGDSLLPE